MNTGIVASRYAKALLDFAAITGDAETVYAEMQQLRRNFRELAMLRTALSNPALSSSRKKELLVEAARLNPDTKVSQSTRRFIELVVKKGRAEVLPFMVISYMEAYEKAHRITRAYLTTASPVAAEIRERMLNLVHGRTGNTIQLHVQTDANLKAGFVLSYDDYRVDASLRGQLEQLRLSWN